MKPTVFHPEARAELFAAASWYERQSPRLGRRFLASVQDTLTRIAINPDLYPRVSANARRALTKTFPFAVIFQDTPEQLIILAVMHLQREPDYWRHRK